MQTSPVPTTSFINTLHQQAAQTSAGSGRTDPWYDYMRGGKIDILSKVYWSPCPEMDIIDWLDRHERNGNCHLRPGREEWYWEEKRQRAASQVRKTPEEIKAKIPEAWKRIYWKGMLPSLTNYNFMGVRIPRGTIISPHHVSEHVLG